jgi:peptidoglycan DL-endopeptidase CwlO
VALVFGLATPVSAAPAPDPSLTAPPKENGPPTMSQLRDNLAAAAEGWYEADAKLKASQKRQAELETEVQIAELEMARVKATVAKYAAEAYRTGRLGVIGMMLSASNSDDFLARAMALDKMTQRDEANLNIYLNAKRRAQGAKAAIDLQIQIQTVETAEMNKRKIAAERALAAVGGTVTRVNIDPASLPTANPVGRNPDGTFPPESCNQDDPTTGGCLTSRTLYMLHETQRLGFDHYVSCWRSGDQYEHPKGRACDWAANPAGFVNRSASGADKVYGDRLSSFFVKNANAFGVMYVVWFCQIWHPAVGWRRYNSAGSNCGDSPAGDHTNHVHVSIL